MLKEYQQSDKYNDKCLRFYNKKGEHVFSMLQCRDGDGYDWALPSGVVVSFRNRIKSDLKSEENENARISE
jgi:hypothetical protein